MEKEQLMEQLQDLLIGMDIPMARKKDIGWLNRNIQINNSEHPNILKALWVLRELNKLESNGL